MAALYIKWLDAKTWSNAWMDGDDISALKLPITESRGEVIKEDNTAIFLAQSKSEDEYRNIIGIPKGCILKQRKIT